MKILNMLQNIGFVVRAKKKIKAIAVSLLRKKLNLFLVCG